MIDRDVPLWHGQKVCIRTIPIDRSSLMALTTNQQADLSLDLAHIRDELKHVEAADETNYQKLAQIRQHLNAIIVALSITDDLPA